MVVIRRIMFGRADRGAGGAGMELADGRAARTAQGPPQKVVEPESAKNPSPEELAQGKLLFQGECGECHGVDASGAAGPGLHGVTQKRGDEGVFSVIRNGIPGTGMAPVSNLNDKRAWEVVAYLHTLSPTDSDEEVKGDPVKGKAIYEANGCATCHTIGGSGRRIRPAAHAHRRGPRAEISARFPARSRRASARGRCTPRAPRIYGLPRDARRHEERKRNQRHPHQ